RGSGDRRAPPARADRPPRPRAAPPHAPTAAPDGGARTAWGAPPAARAPAAAAAHRRTGGPALRPPRARRSSVGRALWCVPRGAMQYRAAAHPGGHLLALAQRVLNHLLVVGDHVRGEKDEQVGLHAMVLVALEEVAEHGHVLQERHAALVQPDRAPQHAPAPHHLPSAAAPAP